MLVAGAIAAGAPTGEQAQLGEQTQTMFCVRVICIVRVEVTAAPLGVVVGIVVTLELGIVVVDEEEEEDAGRVEVVDVLVPVLVLLVLVVEVEVEEEAGIVVVERVLVVREDVDVELVARVVVVDEEDETAPGALPTAEPTQAFQFVTPF